MRTLDIYCLTKHRDLETVNRFLDTYVDRSASENREMEQLYLTPLPPISEKIGIRAHCGEPALTLSNCIESGLEEPRRSFCLALESKVEAIHGATLAFTIDDQLVLGLALDDTTDRVMAMPHAKRLLHRLADEFDCHLGLIASEQRSNADGETCSQREITALKYWWER